MAFLRNEAPSTANLIGPEVGNAAGKFLRLWGGAGNRNAALQEVNAIPTDLDPVRYAGTVAGVLAKYNMQPGPVTQQMLAAQASQYQTGQALGRQQAEREALGGFLRQTMGGDTVSPEPFVQPGSGGVVPLRGPGSSTRARGGFLRAVDEADTRADAFGTAAEAGVPGDFLRSVQTDKEAQRRFDAGLAMEQQKLDFSKIKDERDFAFEKDKFRKSFYTEQRKLGIQEWDIDQKWKAKEDELAQDYKIWQEKKPILEQEAEAKEKAAAGKGAPKISDYATSIRTTLSLYGSVPELPAGMDANSMEAALFLMTSPKGTQSVQNLRSKAAGGDPKAIEDLRFVEEALAAMQGSVGFDRKPGTQTSDPLGLGL